MLRLDSDDAIDASAFRPNGNHFSMDRWDTQRANSDDRFLHRHLRHHEDSSDHGSPTLNVANPTAALDFNSPYIPQPHASSRRDDESGLMSHVYSDTGYATTPDRFISEYEEYERLGHGDFGTVNAATCCADRQRYAIKSSKKQVTGDFDLQHRLQEVYALAAIGPSPHVLRYYDAWVDDGRLFISTELVEGGSARNLNGSQPWDERTLWEFALQIGVGLQTIHASNVAHLDIKPDNILCTHEEGTEKLIFKIGDFGLARPLHINQELGLFPGLNDDEGDARYLCPALLQHPRDPNLQAADVYALGMTLFDLAVPHVDLRYVRKARDYSGLHARGLSSTFVDLVHRMTDPEPANRPTAFDIIACAIDAQRQLPCCTATRGEELDSLDLQAKLATITALRKELQALQSMHPFAAY